VKPKFEDLVTIQEENEEVELEASSAELSRSFLLRFSHSIRSHGICYFSQT